MKTQKNNTTATKAVVKAYEPKSGEWCWFWDYNDEGGISYIFGRFYSKDVYGYWIDKDSNSLITLKHMQVYNNCEPLVGSLPSFLMNKKI
jgi:hypothetical protein